MKRRTIHPTADTTLRALLSSEIGDAGLAALAQGGVYVKGKRELEGDRKLTSRDVVMVVLEEGGLAAGAVPKTPPGLKILYEDRELVAVDKAPGITAQPTAGKVGDSLLDLVSKYLGQPAGLVHRLDRETSGVTVFAKMPSSLTFLSGEFREGRTKKVYVAIAGGVLPAKGKVDLPLSKDPSRPGRFRASKAANGVPAVTEYEVSKQEKEYAVVELHPLTGRTHQLRAHLAALSAPILGDDRYGGASKLSDGRYAPRCLLHAKSLTIAHPRSKTPLVIEAPLPEDFGPFL